MVRMRSPVQFRQKAPTKGSDASEPFNLIKQVHAICYRLFFYVFIVLWPLSQILFTNFNGNQGSYIQIGGTYEFSTKHFDYLFQETYFLNWVLNTIVIALATAILTLIFVSLRATPIRVTVSKGARPP